MSFMNLDYLSLREEDKLFLGTLVNHTLSLSQLLNETIELDEGRMICQGRLSGQ